MRTISESKLGGSRDIIGSTSYRRWSVPNIEKMECFLRHCLGKGSQIGINAMSRLSWLQKIYWTRFAKPVQERSLVRFLIDNPVNSILEIGIGNGDRLQRIAKLVSLSPGCEQLRYIGIDEFESSPASRTHLTLKNAHQLASQLGFKASLIPGTPAQAAARVAHKFGASDLIIIDGGIDLASPTSGVIGGWLNRLAHSASTVIASNQPGQQLTIVDRSLLELPIVKAA